MSEKFRIEKKSNFTVVSNDILMNNFMSMKATCLLMNNYYRLATRVSEDFPNLAQGLKKQMANRLRGLTRNGKLERGFIKERYGKSKQLRFSERIPPHSSRVCSDTGRPAQEENRQPVHPGRTGGNP